MTSLRKAIGKDGRGRHGKHLRGEANPGFKGPITEVCSVPGCTRTCNSHVSIYCNTHYCRLWRGKGLMAPFGKEPNGHCHFCGDAMPGAGPNALYCGDRCSTRARRGNARTAKCMRCGEEFVPWHKAKFCSAKCRQEHTHQRDIRYQREYRVVSPLAAARSNIGSERRRERMRATKVEKFSKLEIMERDGWCCQICGHPIKETLRWPDPMSASLDHKLALARGGEHTRENVRAAHLRCNMQKSHFDELPKTRRLKASHDAFLARRRIGGAP